MTDSQRKAETGRDMQKLAVINTDKDTQRRQRQTQMHDQKTRMIHSQRSMLTLGSLSHRALSMK